MRDALYILGQGFYFVPNALIIRVGYVMSALRIFFYTFVWQRSMGLMKTHALHVHEREQHIRRLISVWLICWNKNGNKRIMMRRFWAKLFTQFRKSLYWKSLSSGKVKIYVFDSFLVIMWRNMMGKKYPVKLMAFQMLSPIFHVPYMHFPV